MFIVDTRGHKMGRYITLHTLKGEIFFWIQQSSSGCVVMGLRALAPAMRISFVMCRYRPMTWDIATVRNFPT